MTCASLFDGPPMNGLERSTRTDQYGSGTVKTMLRALSSISRTLSYGTVNQPRGVREAEALCGHHDGGHRRHRSQSYEAEHRAGSAKHAEEDTNAKACIVRYPERHRDGGDAPKNRHDAAENGHTIGAVALGAPRNEPESAVTDAERVANLLGLGFARELERDGMRAAPVLERQEHGSGGPSRRRASDVLCNDPLTARAGAFDLDVARATLELGATRAPLAELDHPERVENRDRRHAEHHGGRTAHRPEEGVEERDDGHGIRNRPPHLGSLGIDEPDAHFPQD